MKNFEKYIDEIAKDYANRETECIIDSSNCTLEKDCSDCFKRWALEEAKEKGGEE